MNDQEQQLCVNVSFLLPSKDFAPFCCCLFLFVCLFVFCSYFVCFLFVCLFAFFILTLFFYRGKSETGMTASALT